ncbi:MAG: hypothetical protein AAF612_03815 [Planctomycetota bacterium]
MALRAAIVHSNLYVAGAAAAITAASAWEGLAPGVWAWGPTVAAGCGAGCVYTLDRLAGTPSDEPQRGAMFARRAGLLWAWAVVWAAGSVVGIALSSGPARAALLGVAGVSLLYCLPAVRWGGRWRRLAEAPYAKGLLVAVAWALATAAAPSLDTGQDPGVAAWAAIERGLFILALTLPIDLRDLAADQSFGVITPAQRWGERGLRWACAVLLAASAAVAGMRHGPAGAWPAWAACAAGAALVAAASTRRGPAFFAWAPDGVIWLWAGLILVHRQALG